MEHPTREEVEAGIVGEGGELPVIKRTIDNTALSAYMTCPREYNFAYRQHRRPKETKPPLSFGSFWHLLLETHYKTGGAGILTERDKLLEQWEEHGSEDDYRTAPRALSEYENYLKWLNEESGIGVADDLQQTVGFPDNPMVELQTAVKSDRLIHPYAGKIDRLVIDNGLGYVEDHKTTSRKTKYYFEQYYNSNQMKGYTWLAQQLFPSIKIVGVRINLLHVTKTKSGFYRQPITFSDKIIEEWEENTNEWIRRIARDTEEENFPGHFGTFGCTRMYGKCQFFGACQTSPSIRQQYLEDMYEIRPWNPLAVEEDEDVSDE